MHKLVLDALNQNVALKRDLAAISKSQTINRREFIHSKNVDFVEGLFESGAVLEEQIEAFIATLDYIESADGVVEFGEGEDRQPLSSALKEIFSYGKKC